MYTAGNSENQLTTVYGLLLLVLIYIGIAIGMFSGPIGEVSYFNLGTLTIPSAGLFLVICLLAIWKRTFYFLFLVFIILAFPAPVDDIFPSVTLSNPDDKAYVVFPMITRIDLYLILGIALKAAQKNFKIKVIEFSVAIKIFILLYSIVFLVNIFKSNDFLDYNLLMAYSFHYRYLLLFMILLQLYDIRIYERQIVLGFVISVIFLYVEAHLNTFIKGNERLLSGSLSLNTFANISGAMAIYIIYLLRNNKIKKWLGYLTIFVVFLIIMGSETRGAILTVVLTFLFLSFIANPRKFVRNVLKAFLGLAILLSFYFYASNNDIIPKRYSFSELTEKINIDFSKEGLTEIINVERSWETNSIRARLSLFGSSIAMIGEHPLTGIGSGRWNRYKNTYVKEKTIPKVLIDSHNDYLSLMSQYGLILGFIFSFIIFLYPMILSKKIFYKYNGPLKFLYVIPFAMGFAALSNSGFYKHQVAALTLFCLCVAHNLYQKHKYE